MNAVISCTSNLEIVVDFDLVVASPCKNTVYYSTIEHVQCWNPITKTSYTALNLFEMGLGASRICSLDALDDILIVGGCLFNAGFHGEYILKTNQAYHGKVTQDINGITNHLHLLKNNHRGILFNQDYECLISSNDGHLRTLDIQTMKITADFITPWPVNCTKSNPDNRLACIVGDSKDSFVVSLNTGEGLGVNIVMAILEGHADYSFACAWSPCGKYIATGSQDKTTRLYDARNLSQPLRVYESQMASVRSLQFSDQGCLALAEAADYVHLIDPLGDVIQTIGIFGEIAGISFDASGDTFWISNADDAYGCLIEFIKAK